MGILFVLLTVVFIAVCILMVAVVLIQPHEGGGLAGAFGGGVNDSVFGTNTISFAWKFTIALVIIYFALAVVINKLPVTRTEERPNLSGTAPSAPEKAPVPAEK